MEYWTFLVITLAAPFEGYVSTLPYRNEDLCRQDIALIERASIEPIDMIQCLPTDIPSRTIRPKRNPIYTEN